MTEDAGTGIPVQEGESMMGRLIDADANREDFMERVYDILSDEQDNIKANLIIDAFDEMPTAYDLDKVVEQLEEKIELAYRRYRDCPSFARYQTRYQERQMCLDIVKRGGTDE